MAGTLSQFLIKYVTPACPTRAEILQRKSTSITEMRRVMPWNSSKNLGKDGKGGKGWKGGMGMDGLSFWRVMCCFLPSIP
jgi:hypothetical protein